MQSIGDLAQQLTMRARHGRLKAEIADLGEALTSGLKSDPAADRDGDTLPISGLQSGLSRLRARLLVNTETGLVADTTQRVLADMQDLTGQLATDFLKVDLSSSASARAALSASAEQVFEALVGGLNTHLSGRSLFAGTSTEAAALSSAGEILGHLRSELAGAVTTSDVLDVVNNWFDLPGGGFETLGYRGSVVSLAPTALTETETVALDLRADDPALRAVLKYTVLGQLSQDPALGFSPETQAVLMRRAGEGLLNAQTPLTDLRADIGAKQERITRATERNTRNQSALQIARNDILAADPYAAATRLEQAQAQLESLYAVTARQTRLRLVDFLR